MMKQLHASTRSDVRSMNGKCGTKESPQSQAKPNNRRFSHIGICGTSLHKYKRRLKNPSSGSQLQHQRVGSPSLALGRSTWKLLLEMFCFLSWVAVLGEFVLLCFIHNLHIYVHQMSEYSVKEKENRWQLTKGKRVANSRDCIAAIKGVALLSSWFSRSSCYGRPRETPGVITEVVLLGRMSVCSRLGLLDGSLQGEGPAPPSGGRIAWNHQDGEGPLVWC